MSIQYCPEGSTLIAGVSRALLEQCELPDAPEKVDAENDLERAGSEAVQLANQRANEHIIRCPICRTL